MSKYAAVVPDTRAILPHDFLTYAVPDELEMRAVVGQRVSIPLGKKDAIGWVVECNDATEFEDVREIYGVLDDGPLMSAVHVQLARWIARYYCAPLGETIKAMLPVRIRLAKPGAKPRAIRKPSRVLAGGGETDVAPTLTTAQQAVVDPIVVAIHERKYQRFLLHGVTGSGKTEVYLRAIDAALQMGRQAIALVPEIALTPQTMRRFAARFGDRVTVIHSALTDAERAQQWRRIQGGEVDVVVGSRSAIFAPLERLGVVVIDEEDSSSYKQDRVPRYHAVDVASELARMQNAVVMMGSATPRLETFYSAHTGGATLLELPERINQRALPPVELVDLREEIATGNSSPLSRTLMSALRDCHQSGGQSILFLNRRGSATVVMCRQCGEALTCQSCSVSLVYHHSRRRCDCHYCGASSLLPSLCPACKQPRLRLLGTGTEGLEAEIAEAFPTMRLLRMDRDTTKTRDAHFEIYEAFRKGEADCMIGTQMVAKGWDLGNVRLVGIINADSTLHFPDYRSGETTFSLLTQVAGRAGRSNETARVILQTYSPDAPSIQHALAHDYLGFARYEIRFRKLLKFPPYSRLVTCTFSHAEDDKARAEAARAAAELGVEFLNRGLGAEILGPSAAFVHRAHGVYRWQITVRGDVAPGLELLPRGRGWSIDVDPSA